MEQKVAGKMLLSVFVVFFLSFSFFFFFVAERICFDSAIARFER